MAAKRSIEVHALHWRGVNLEITFERHWLGIERHIADAHLTVTARGRQPLPITETGYRSHFLAADEIDSAGGPVAYIAIWLDTMARSQEWIAYEQASRQLSLF